MAPFCGTLSLPCFLLVPINVTDDLILRSLNATVFEMDVPTVCRQG